MHMWGRTTYEIEQVMTGMNRSKYAVSPRGVENYESIYGIGAVPART